MSVNSEPVCKHKYKYLFQEITILIFEKKKPFMFLERKGLLDKYFGH